MRDLMEWGPLAILQAQVESSEALARSHRADAARSLDKAAEADAKAAEFRRAHELLSLALGKAA